MSPLTPINRELSGLTGLTLLVIVEDITTTLVGVVTDDTNADETIVIADKEVMIVEVDVVGTYGTMVITKLFWDCGATGTPERVSM